jgi:hypothetical protein
VTSAEARKAARRYQASTPPPDPPGEVWRRSRPGEAVLVRTFEGEPSYWLVPMQESGRLVGFVRVTPAGRVAAAGAHRAGSGGLSVVTGITAEEAASRAIAANPGGSLVGEPVFVHDGPPGREGWRVEVEGPDGTSRLLLVTPGGISPPSTRGEPG